MSFWDNWSDGKKWLMGMVSTVLITAIVGIGTFTFNTCVTDIKEAEKELVIHSSKSGSGKGLSVVEAEIIHTFELSECRMGRDGFEGAK